MQFELQAAFRVEFTTGRYETRTPAIPDHVLATMGESRDILRVVEMCTSVYRTEWRLSPNSAGPVTNTGPLAGVNVIELGGIGPGAHAGMMLADLGADVV